MFNYIDLQNENFILVSKLAYYKCFKYQGALWEQK